METYSCLTDEESSQYEVVKEAILNAYKLVPEAYRMRFRNAKKTASQTYLEYARVKEQHFKDWCSSLSVTSIEDLRQVILLEDFKNNIPPSIKLYIEESHVDRLTRAAELADEYSLTHFYNQKSQLEKNQKPWTSSQKQADKVTAKADSKPESQNSKELICYFCKRKGHVVKNCFKFKASLKEKKPVGFISKNEISNSELRGREWKQTLKDFGEHLLTGSLAESVNDVHMPIQVLRDTGAAVSLVLRSKLPENLVLSEQEYVLIGGFPGSCVSCPV